MKKLLLFFFLCTLFSGSFSYSQCNPSEQCIYTFTLLDGFGDGLNGETMSVFQDGILVAQLNDPTNAAEQTFTFEVALCHDHPFELFWNMGGLFPNETGVTIHKSV
ncbi:MAG TPA: hypothetical protein VK528_13390 [Flavobacterium sp.]|nr:hypothetical protein [Flavobacterium sp.]